MTPERFAELLCQNLHMDSPVDYFEGLKIDTEVSIQRVLASRVAHAIYQVTLLSTLLPEYEQRLTQMENYGLKFDESDPYVCACYDLIKLHTLERLL